MLTTINHIIYATDLGEDMAPTLNMAMSLADKYQAQVSVVHVIEPINPTVYSLGSTEMWHEIRANGLTQAQRILNDQIDNFFAELKNDSTSFERPTIHVANGNVTESILELADNKNADLIVMGSHGYSALGELLLGSIADKVMRLSKRPVLLVPVVK